jgi:hypothetical protein
MVTDELMQFLPNSVLEIENAGGYKTRAKFLCRLTVLLSIAGWNCDTASESSREIFQYSRVLSYRCILM